MIVLIAGFYIGTLFGASPMQPPQHTIQETIESYARGTFAEVFRMRAQEWAEVNSFVFFLTRILGIFLFGLYLWRKGYLRQPSEHLGWWRRAQKIGLTAGILGNVLWVAIDWVWHPESDAADATDDIPFFAAVGRAAGTEPRLRIDDCALVAGTQCGSAG